MMKERLMLMENDPMRTDNAYDYDFYDDVDLVGDYGQYYDYWELI